MTNYRGSAISKKSMPASFMTTPVLAAGSLPILTRVRSMPRLETICHTGSVMPVYGYWARTKIRTGILNINCVILRTFYNQIHINWHNPGRLAPNEVRPNG